MDLNGKGFQIIRFTNEQVFADLAKVINEIKSELDSRPNVDGIDNYHDESDFEGTLKSAEEASAPLPWRGDGGEAEPFRFLSLRQQAKKADGLPNLALSDFVAPKESGLQDHFGLFAVGVFGAEERVNEMKAAHDDYNAILLQSLSDRLAEAFAEHLHERVRKEYWGYEPQEQLSNDDLIAEKYRGIRPAPGYPACPDHLDKRTLWNVLQVEKRIGLTLTESMAMWPAAAVSGYYLAHPQSKYFGVGKIDKDQVEDYAQRRGVSLKEAEKWLAPALNY
ncbi:MAG: hypothetical protein C0424_08025 [Sphingobacteriaceae bacterium]|nr:hypothetical protein [Sphingobacteriaceae bacterium]